MHDHLESIIADLYTLDPSLREQDRDVRAIVHTLITEKPAVLIDPSFVTDLRRTILTKQQQTPSSWTAWLVHFAPVGAIALIMLILAPKFTGPTPLPKGTAPTADTFAVEAPTMMSAKNIADMADPESTSLTQVGYEIAPSDSFTLAPQRAGRTVQIDFATLSAPGFITINRVNEDGTIGDRVGTSALLYGGTTEAFAVPLTVPMVVGDIFYAVLYPDNGDTLFTDSDTALFTQDGAQPMSTLFSVEAFVTPRYEVQ